MDSQHYDRIKRDYGRGQRVPRPECLDVPSSLYTTLTGLFMGIAKLDPEGDRIRVKRVWIDDGQLRVVAIGEAAGLDDLIAEAEEEAVTVLGLRTEDYPLRPDARWYADLLVRHPNIVPEIDRLRIRRGLQTLAADLIDESALADRFKVCRLASLTTRNAGFVIVEVAFTENGTEADRRMIDLVVRRYQAALSSHCEHCGSNANLAILKIGMEALLDNLGAELGDRLLCGECFKEMTQ